MVTHDSGVCCGCRAGGRQGWPGAQVRGEQGGLSCTASVLDYHVLQGRQQRDRRKLREKRRSTGVVRLGREEESSEGAGTETGEEGGHSQATQPHCRLSETRGSAHSEKKFHNKRYTILSNKYRILQKLFSTIAKQVIFRLKTKILQWLFFCFHLFCGFICDTIDKRQISLQSCCAIRNY